MTGLSQNLQVADPQLLDLLDLHILTVMRRFKCHDLGTIQSFDEETQTASVSINYSRVIPSPDPSGQDTITSYPVLVMVPIYVAGGGGFFMTFPFQPGDTCQISYNDRDIDNWFQSGQVGPVASTRMHSMSDGIAFVGVRSKANALAAYDTTGAVLGNGTSLVRVGTKIKVANASGTLYAAMDMLTTALDTFAKATALAAIEPTLGPAAAALKIAVAAYKLALQAVIE